MRGRRRCSSRSAGRASSPVPPSSGLLAHPQFPRPRLGEVDFCSAFSTSSTSSTKAGLVSNFVPIYTNKRVSTIPSIKLDHSVSSRLKLSGYWSMTRTDSPNAMGFPYPIANAIPAHIKAQTTRGNIDFTVKPTLLLHIGGGYLLTTNDAQVPYFSPQQQLGFQGANAVIFPYFAGINQNTGGSENLGPPSYFAVKDYKPTGTVSLSWVKNNHTYKFGGEGVINRYPTLARTLHST